MNTLHTDMNQGRAHQSFDLPRRLALFALSALAAGPAAATHVDLTSGREWLQVSTTRGLSWDQISTVCSTTSGVCSGAIQGLDLSGWTWAARQDVSALFVNSGLPASNGSVGASVFEAFVDLDGAAGPDTGYFEATYAVPTLAYVQGMTRELGPNGQLAYAPYVSSSPQLNTYSVSHTGLQSRSAESAYAGAWLFREAGAAEIPEPGSLGLAAAALLCLRLVRRPAARQRSARPSSSAAG